MIRPRIWLFCSIVLAAILPALTQTSPEVNSLENFYHNKCLKASGTQESFEKLRTNVYEMYKYFEYAFQYLPNNRKAFCGDQRENLLVRIKEIEVDLKNCLLNKEKFFAKFVKESFEELLHFFCHNNGEYTTRFFSSEGAQCRQAIEATKSNDLDNCLNRIFAPTRDYLTQSEICDDVTVLRKCFAQTLDVYCPKSKNMKSLNENFFNFIGKPCSGCRPQKGKKKTKSLTHIPLKY